MKHLRRGWASTQRVWERYKRFEAWGERVVFKDHPAFWGILLCFLFPPLGIVIFIGWLSGRSDRRNWGDPWEEGDPWTKEPRDPTPEQLKRRQGLEDKYGVSRWKMHGDELFAWDSEGDKAVVSKDGDVTWERRPPTVR